MNTYRRFSYDEMQELTYKKCVKLKDELNGEIISIKGHDVFLLDFKDNWGYSAIVFLNGKHLYYADDYQLHHRTMGVVELRKWYINTMNNKLYTLEELKNGTPKDYDEYKARDYYIRNYFTQQFERLSIFAISKEDNESFNRRKRFYPYYSNVGFAYFKSMEIVELLEELINLNEKNWNELKNNEDLFRKAIRRELWNYECCISGRVDEAINALGLSGNKLTDIQRLIVNEEYNKCIDDYCKAM